MICYHHNDLDGRCAAAIVLKKHPRCYAREICYKDNPVFADEIQRNDDVFIVDFSFKPDKMRELLDLLPADKIIWVDHHKTAKDYNYNLRGLRDFTTPGKSGCELTWKFLYPNEPMPEAVRLLGDYDCWRFDTEEQTKLFQLGMRSVTNAPDAPIWEFLLKDSGVDNIINDGIVATRYRDGFCGDYRKSFGWAVNFEGLECYALNLYMVGSLGFGDKIDEYSVCLACVYQAGKWTVSLYSKTVDVSVIAQKYGGGGHKGAAGFVCEKLPF